MTHTHEDPVRLQESVRDDSGGVQEYSEIFAEGDNES